MNDTWTYGFQGLMTQFTDLGIDQIGRAHV